MRRLIITIFRPEGVVLLADRTPAHLLLLLPEVVLVVDVEGIDHPAVLLVTKPNLRNEDNL